VEVTEELYKPALAGPNGIYPPIVELNTKRRSLVFNCKTFFISIWIMILGVNPTAFATADGPDAWCVKNVKKGDFLNLRDEPSISGSVIARIPPDTCGLKSTGHCVGRNEHEATESDAPKVKLPRLHWCPVKWGDKAGWVSLIYLREDLTP